MIPDGEPELELFIDAHQTLRRTTGIFVRARYSSGEYTSVDVADLTTLSALRWLRSRGGRNEWAERMCLMLLGRTHVEISDAFAALAAMTAEGKP